MDGGDLIAEWVAYLPPPSTEEGDGTELEEALRTLAKVVQILGISDASFSSYSNAIMNMSTRHLSLTRSLSGLKRLEEELKDQLASLNHHRDLLSHWNETLKPGSSGSSLLEDVSTLERRKDAVVRKAREYHRELEALLVEQPLETAVTLGQLVSQKEKNLTKERELKEKRAKIKTFQGLPPNLELARHELRLARQRQMELIKLRERLLRNMADSLE